MKEIERLEMSSLPLARRFARYAAKRAEVCKVEIQREPAPGARIAVVIYGRA
jgi:hypothetical protein